MKDYRCKVKKNKDNKVINYELQRDNHSSFIPYCTYDEHRGVLYPSVYKKCKRLRCFHLHIFRPEGIDEEIKKAGTRKYKEFSEIELKIIFL